MDKSHSLSYKIKNGNPCVLFELVPPPAEYKKSIILDSLTALTQILSRTHVDGINIPEVIDEHRNGERTIKFPDKLKPRILAKYLHSMNFKNIIINRPVVYHPWDYQSKWLKQTYNKYDIKNFILVGGESSKNTYPGYSVTKSAQEIMKNKSHNFPEILLGGITIPTRKNEAERLYKKTLFGIDFFTTQILYEPESLKKLLAGYWKICQKKNEKPKMILLSFAPVITKKDIELLLWLGVKIPETTLKKLKSGWLGVGHKSTDICINILKDIFSFIKKYDISIPVGLNIGYVNRNNFEFSLEFLEKMSGNYLSEIKKI